MLFILYAVNRFGFEQKLNTAAGAGNRHAIGFAAAAIGKIAAAADDLAPGVKICHGAGAESGRGGIFKGKAVAGFQPDAAVFLFRRRSR